MMAVVVADGQEIAGNVERESRGRLLSYQQQTAVLIMA